MERFFRGELLYVYLYSKCVVWGAIYIDSLKVNAIGKEIKKKILIAKPKLKTERYKIDIATLIILSNFVVSGRS